MAAAIDALAIPLARFGCGPSKKQLYAMRLEDSLAETGLGNYLSSFNTDTDYSVKRCGPAENTFLVSRKLYAGRDGAIHLFIDKNGHLGAAKQFFADGAQSVEQVANREAQLLARFGDASARTVVTDSGEVYMLMRAAETTVHGLSRGADGWSAAQRSNLARSTLQAVSRQLAPMHAAGYAHRDVKPGNIRSVSRWNSAAWRFRRCAASGRQEPQLRQLRHAGICAARSTLQR